MVCLNCKSETKNPKFCSKSCAATYNNALGIYNRRKPEGSCKNCKIEIRSSRTYCDECYSSNARHTRKIPMWLSGEWRGGSDSGISQIIRKYLLEQCNYSCSKCGFNKNHPLDGRTILEINHIDGNGLNHSPENLEVLCPNCHALTSSYRARNIGNGRPVYYLRKKAV
jgi:5-methylcytosine-specific restriction endonuclease McrA